MILTYLTTNFISGCALTKLTTATLVVACQRCKVNEMFILVLWQGWRYQKKLTRVPSNEVTSSIDLKSALCRRMGKLKVHKKWDTDTSQPINSWQNILSTAQAIISYQLNSRVVIIVPVGFAEGIAEGSLPFVWIGIFLFHFLIFVIVSLGCRVAVNDYGG